MMAPVTTKKTKGTVAPRAVHREDEVEGCSHSHEYPLVRLGLKVAHASPHLMAASQEQSAEAVGSGGVTSGGEECVLGGDCPRIPSGGHEHSL